MPGPLIVIAGSADPKRIDYEPPIPDVDGLHAAAEQLGGELAGAECRILVYSSAFIEAEVVRGFVGAKTAPAKSIQVRFPAGTAAASFPEFENNPELFDFQSDPHPEWEASFYRSLREANGVLLLGGGASTFITGHIALGYRIPLIAVATFGGAAAQVWKTIVPGQDLPSREDTDLMARPRWSAAAAGECVRSLLGQHERRLQELAAEYQAGQARIRATSFRSVFAGILFLLAVATLPVGLWALTARPLLFQALLFFGGALAGASGSTIRLVWTNEASASALRTGVLGLVAGGVSAILYLLAQVTSNPAALGIGGGGASGAPQPNALLVVAVMIGFIAGFTFDAVYRKLAQTDVVRTEAVAAKRP
jgi:hypothetical protein